MRFWWLVDRQGTLFNVHWAPGDENLGDYYTKKHRPTHHKAVRPVYTYEEGKSPSSMQGCIEILKRAHSKSAPKTNFQDTKPTTNPTSNTLLDIARIPARNQRHKQPKYLHRLLSQ